MKSITLHNIDEPLLALVKAKAKAQEMSINQFLKDLIERSIGYRRPAKARNYDDFKDLCGVWSPEQRKEFESGIKDFEMVDLDEWQ